MEYIKLQEQHILDYLGSNQIELLKSAQNFGDRNPLDCILLDICAYVRSFVPNRFVDESMGTKIPIETKAFACFLAIEALQSRLPELLMTADQIRNANNARLGLEKLSNRLNSREKERYRGKVINNVRHRKPSHLSSMRTTAGL